jgi:hypothetical protein
MKFSALTFIALAASSVYGSVIDVEARDAADTYVDLETRATCWKSDMQAIKDRINHYNVFCQAFLLRYVFRTHPSNLSRQVTNLDTDPTMHLLCLH